MAAMGQQHAAYAAQHQMTMQPGQQYMIAQQQQHTMTQQQVLQHQQAQQQQHVMMQQQMAQAQAAQAQHQQAAQQAQQMQQMRNGMPMAQQSPGMVMVDPRVANQMLLQQQQGGAAGQAAYMMRGQVAPGQPMPAQMGAPRGAPPQMGRAGSGVGMQAMPPPGAAYAVRPGYGGPGQPAGYPPQQPEQ